MAEGATCKVFQSHAWKKELCANCMKARALHKNHLGPVPAQRTTRSRKGASTSGSTSSSSVKSSSGTGSVDGAIAQGKNPIIAGGNDEEVCSVVDSCSATGDAECKAESAGMKVSRNTSMQPKAVSERTKPRPKKVTAEGHDGRVEKPAIASKPQGSRQSTATAKAPDTKKKPATQSNNHAKENKPVNSSKDAGDQTPEGICKVKSDKSAAASGKSSNYMYSSKTGSRPKVPPPKTPEGEAKGRCSPRTTEQQTGQKLEKNKQASSKPHIKGLSEKVEEKSVMDKTSGANLEAGCSKTVVPSGGGGGGHYYHEYDVTRSLSRKMAERAEVTDKRAKQLLADIALTPPYKVVDLSNRPAGLNRDSTCMPPSLPKTLPPEQDSGKQTSKCGTSARLISRGQSGSSGSITDELLVDRRMPFILQEEAARMREQSKSPPPIRKVPIMIPSRDDARLSHTYEPIEDPTTLEPESTSQFQQDVPGQSADPGSDYSDCSQTNVGCLSFTKHSKSRGASPAKVSVPSESRMAALASLDLLKGIAGRVASSPSEEVEGNLQQTEVEVESGSVAVISSLCTTGGTPQVNLKSGEAAKLRKSGRSFFKKLLKLGSKDSSGSLADGDTASEDSGSPSRLHLDTQRASEAMSAGVISDHQQMVRGVLSAQPASAGEDRQAMFVDVRNALSRRNASAPDICRELAGHEVTVDGGSWTESPERDVMSAGTSGSQTHLPHVDTGPAPVVAPGVLMKKKPNMTSSTYSVCEGKINNIQQAEEMARSLGIDKVSPRNKSSLVIAPRMVLKSDAMIQAEPSSEATIVKTLSSGEVNTLVKVKMKAGAISPTNKPATPAKPSNMTASKSVSSQKTGNKPFEASVSSENYQSEQSTSEDTSPKQSNDLSRGTTASSETNYGIISSRNVRPISPKPKLTDVLPKCKNPATSGPPSIPVKPQKKPIDVMSMSATSITNNPAATENIVTSPARSLPELSLADTEGEPTSPTEGCSREEAVASPLDSPLGDSREYDAVSPEPASPTGEGSGISRAYRKSDVRGSKVQRSRMPAPPPPPALPTSPTPGSKGSPGLESRTPAPGTNSSDQSPPTQAKPPNYEPRASASTAQARLPNYEARTDIRPPARTTSVQGVRRPSGLKAEDISGPIILGEGPDFMSRSFSSPTDDRKAVDDLVCSRRNPGKRDSMAKHGRNRTVADIDLSLVSPDSEVQFDTQGRRSSRFLNRALPPTPAESTPAPREVKVKASRPSTTSLIKEQDENEYELVSLDGDADEREATTGSVERPDYEDIDSGDEVEEAEGVYSDPMDLLRDPPLAGLRGKPGTLGRGDEYLAPVSGSGDENKPAPLPRIVGKRSPRVQRRSRNSGGTFYTNADDDDATTKPLLTISDGFSKMGLRNVQTLESRSLSILSNLLPQKSEFVADLRWSDFSLMRSLPLLEIGDVAIYEMRNAKVKPHDGFLMVSEKSLSRSLLNWRCSGLVAPSLMFQDKISTEFFPRQSRGDKTHYHMTSTVEMNVAVLGYSSMMSLDTWINDLDPVFTSDLTEYERKACLWISQIISAVLDLAEKSPQLDDLDVEHVVAVTVPSCGQCYPILIIPDAISITTDPEEEDTNGGVTLTNWDHISSGIIKILFRLLRLDSKDKTSPNAVPIRTKYSRGIQKFINELTSSRTTKDPLRSLGLGKLLMETMLWGPGAEEAKSLLCSGTPVEGAFQIWLEVQRCTAVNELASGSFHNTPEFANMLWYWCSSTGQTLLDVTKLLYC